MFLIHIDNEKTGVPLRSGHRRLQPINLLQCLLFLFFPSLISIFPEFRILDPVFRRVEFRIFPLLQLLFIIFLRPYRLGLNNNKIAIKLSQTMIPSPMSPIAHAVVAVLTVP